MASASDNIFLAAPTGAGVPVAQTCVDLRIGTSTGYASSPYPGETVLSLVGASKFPGYAYSQYPTDPQSKQGGPGFSATSSSKEHSSNATAEVGLSEQQAQAAFTVASAQSLVDPGTGKASATATSDTSPLSVNDVLELGRIRSSATATVTAAGKLQRESALQVGRTTVAGQEVQITSDGVEAAGEKLARPNAADPNKVLAQAGIQVRFIREQKTGQGVISAGIEVIATQTNPDSGAKYVAHYTVGRAFASAEAVEPVSGLNQLPPLPPPPVANDGPPVNQGPAASAGQGSAASAGQGLAAPAETGSIAGGSAAPKPAPVPEVAPGDAVSAPKPAVAAPMQRTSMSPVDIGATTLYLVLAFCGLVLFANGTLLRLLGVKAR